MNQATGSAEGLLQEGVPADLSDVALVDGPTIAKAGRMSYGMFLAEVRDGRAPQPFVKRRRFSRWRVVDIRAWLANLGSEV